MTVQTALDLDRFNALPAEQAEALLLTCCRAPRWARAVAGGRPYPTVEHLQQTADDVLAGLAEDDVDAALAGHPRIGERATGAEAAYSSREQAGLAGTTTGTLQALADGNRAYEERFGHVYLVCATGRDAGELLGLLRERLGNDPATERRVLREELRKINRIRLSGLVPR